MLFGYKPEEIYKLFKKYCKKIKYIDFANIFKVIFGLIIKREIIIDGLNSKNTIEKIMNEACLKKGIKNINEIKTNLIIPAVDLNNGQIYMFTSNMNRELFSDDIVFENDIEIGKAVQASCSYPGVFSPFTYKNTKLIDGGIRENVPWKITKINGADKVISIIFEKEINNKKKNKNIIEVASRAIDILSHELSTYELAGADYLIKIKTKDIDLLDINKIDYLYNLGYEIGKKEASKHLTI